MYEHLINECTFQQRLFVEMINNKNNILKIIVLIFVKMNNAFITVQLVNCKTRLKNKTENNERL